MEKLRHFQNEGVLFFSSFLVNVRKPLEWLIIGLDHGRTLLFENMVYSISCKRLIVLHLIFLKTGTLFVNVSHSTTNQRGKTSPHMFSIVSCNGEKVLLSTRCSVSIYILTKNAAFSVSQISFEEFVCFYPRESFLFELQSMLV